MMAGRKLMIAGNWKMYKTASEARSLVRDIKAGLGDRSYSCEILVAPPFTSISAAVEEAKGTSIMVAGQNLHWESQGAYTGEVSAAMLKEAGCSHVIIGHSERRQYFHETDETINLKIKAAINGGLTPIFCLGETFDERQYGATFDVVHRQFANAMQGIEISDSEKFIIAYEPVWAIGTGLTATPEQAQEVHSYLRKELEVFCGPEIANGTRILYGGSVKPDNSKTLLSCPDIDGGLIGGASLKAKDFIGIMEAGI
jgi:triosephosphate isomerase